MKSRLVREAPLNLVLRNLLRRGLLLLDHLGHREVVLRIDELGVEVGVVTEDRRHLLVFEDGFPRALGLAYTAIDAFLGIDEELIREGRRVVAVVTVDTVNRADFDAGLVDTRSGTVFDPFLGLGRSGPLADQNLGRLPGFTSFRGDYRTFFPEGRIWPD